MNPYLINQTDFCEGDDTVEHYCCKCLVNKVANEGDICASCGGNTSKSIEQPTPHRVPIDPQIPDVESVSIPTRRRIISGATNNSSQATNNNQSTDSTTYQTAYTANTAPQQPSSTASTQKAAKKKANEPLQGVIQNFDSGVDERSFLVRVADSLFKGISYNGKNNLVMTEFQLYENWTSGFGGASSAQPIATRVVCYGKISQGRPVENNDVRVYGVRDKTNNYFIAEQIENTTDGTYATFVPQKMSATFVRLIVLALILVILGLFSGISFPTGSAGMMSASMYQIVIGLIAILAGVVTFFFAKNNHRPGTKNNHRPGRKPLLISLAALLVVLGIFIITLQDAETKVAQLWDGLLNVLVYMVVFRLGFSLLLGLGRPNPQVDKVLNICFIGLGAIMSIYLALSIFLA